MIDSGIYKFKCATIAECEIAAQANAKKIILAYPLVGPNIKRFINLIERYKNITFYAIGDNKRAITQLNEAFGLAHLNCNFLIDVNMGMNRTGVPIENLLDLYIFVKECKNLNLKGFHCYDGNHNDKNLSERQKEVDFTIASLQTHFKQYETDYRTKPIIVAGGTPAFPCYVKYSDIFCSPGTCFIYDKGYQQNLPDLKFVPAATVLTRVISHPADGIFTIDCGYKAIASDPKVLRGYIIGYEDKIEEVLQSEEHWVFKMKEGFKDQIPNVGDVLYVIPTHICPTSALYPEVLVCERNKITTK